MENSRIKEEPEPVHQSTANQDFTRSDRDPVLPSSEAPADSPAPPAPPLFQQPEDTSATPQDYSMSRDSPSGNLPRSAATSERQSAPAEIIQDPNPPTPQIPMMGNVLEMEPLLDRISSLSEKIGFIEQLRQYYCTQCNSRGRYPANTSNPARHNNAKPPMAFNTTGRRRSRHQGHSARTYILPPQYPCGIKDPDPCLTTNQLDASTQRYLENFVHYVANQLRINRMNQRRLGQNDPPSSERDLENFVNFVANQLRINRMNQNRLGQNDPPCSETTFLSTNPEVLERNASMGTSSAPQEDAPNHPLQNTNPLVRETVDYILDASPGIVQQQDVSDLSSQNLNPPAPQVPLEVPSDASRSTTTASANAGNNKFRLLRKIRWHLPPGLQCPRGLKIPRMSSGNNDNPPLTSTETGQSTLPDAAQPKVSDVDNKNPDSDTPTIFKVWEEKYKALSPCEKLVVEKNINDIFFAASITKFEEP